jgi:predicted house-cleaning noncanonical NTP pyrophosphatase (MazG superfamily)
MKERLEYIGKEKGKIIQFLNDHPGIITRSQKFFIDITMYLQKFLKLSFFFPLNTEEEIKHIKTEFIEKMRQENIPNGQVIFASKLLTDRDMYTLLENSLKNNSIEELDNFFKERNNAELNQLYTVCTILALADFRRNIIEQTEADALLLMIVRDYYNVEIIFIQDGKMILNTFNCQLDNKETKKYFIVIHYITGSGGISGHYESIAQILNDQKKRWFTKDDELIRQLCPLKERGPGYSLRVTKNATFEKIREYQRKYFPLQEIKFPFDLTEAKIKAGQRQLP